MSMSEQQPGQWIHVSGSGNNIATGAGSHAGDITMSGAPGQDVAALLAQIRRIADGAADRAAGAQAHAAVAAIESDLARPPAHRFSIVSALTALSKLGTALPGLAKVADALSKALH
jgi:hypothetical protein